MILSLLHLLVSMRDMVVFSFLSFLHFINVSLHLYILFLKLFDDCYKWLISLVVFASGGLRRSNCYHHEGFLECVVLPMHTMTNETKWKKELEVHDCFIRPHNGCNVVLWNNGSLLPNIRDLLSSSASRRCTCEIWCLWEIGFLRCLW